MTTSTPCPACRAAVKLAELQKNKGLGYQPYAMELQREFVILLIAYRDAQHSPDCPDDVDW